VIAHGFATGLALALCVVFALAIGHKVAILLRGGPVVEPLLQFSAWTKRHARALLAVGACLEAAVIALLLLVPSLGLLVAAALLSGYAFALRRLDPDVSCNCFGSLSSTRAHDAVTRNLLLSAFCVVASLLTIMVARTTPDAELVAGIAAIALAFLLAIEAVFRLPSFRRL
jgi:energy-coupling factor transporter transmembrane protein EcfT